MMKDHGYTAKRNYSECWIESDTTALLISYEPARLINKTRVTLEVYRVEDDYELAISAYFGADVYKHGVVDILAMSGLFVDSFDDETRNGFKELETERRHLCSYLGVCPF